MNHFVKKKTIKDFNLIMLMILDVLSRKRLIQTNSWYDNLEKKFATLAHRSNGFKLPNIALVPNHCSPEIPPSYL